MSRNSFLTMLEYALPFLKAHRIYEAIAPAITTIQPDILDQVAQKFIASLKPEAVKNLNGRLERGLELAKSGAVIARPDPAHPRCFQVRSSDDKSSYKVDLEARTCECQDSLKGNTCKHRIASYYFEQADKIKPVQPVPIPMPVKAFPQPVLPPTPVKPVSQPATPSPKPISREEQILKELGYAPEPKKVQTMVPVSTVQLGTLYRHFLHGSALGNQAYKVTITDITKEKVTPHPSQPTIEKWCLWVSGLPTGFATAILFGTRAEEDLMAIFGNVDIHSLKGKQIVIYSKPMNVGGQPKQSIRFRGVL